MKNDPSFFIFLIRKMNRIKGGINKPRGQLETKTTDTKETEREKT
jgi:hypothetical protein